MNSGVSYKNSGYEATAVLNMGSTNQTTPNGQQRKENNKAHRYSSQCLHIL